MTDEKILDCRGLGCPQPVIKTKQVLEEATGPFVVIVDNEGSSTNVTRFAESQGASVQTTVKGGDHHLTITPGAGGEPGEEPPIVCSTSTAGRDMVIHVSSMGMGRGDEELGAVLMAAFLDTLSQFASEISHALFVNAGAKLAIEGSPVLEQIRALEQMGVTVLVCGTCLNHFQVKEKLAVGSVSNMFAIIETLAQAGRVIRP